MGYRARDFAPIRIRHRFSTDDLRRVEGSSGQPLTIGGPRERTTNGGESSGVRAVRGIACGRADQLPRRGAATRRFTAGVSRVKYSLGGSG